MRIDEKRDKRDDDRRDKREEYQKQKPKMQFPLPPFSKQNFEPAYKKEERDPRIDKYRQ